jgi:hypothetical protein
MRGGCSKSKTMGRYTGAPFAKALAPRRLPEHVSILSDSDGRLSHEAAEGCCAAGAAAFGIKADAPLILATVSASDPLQNST